MEIKKTGKGYEVDGITFDRRDLAERYVASKGTLEKADTAWLDEKIERVFDPGKSNPSFRIFIEGLAGQHDLTLGQVAEKVGVTRQTLYNWMDARVIPDPASIEKICRGFAVSRDEVTMATIDNFAAVYPELVSKIMAQAEDAAAGRMKLAPVLKLLAQELGPLDIAADVGGDKALAMQWKGHSISLVYRADSVLHVSVEPFKVKAGPSFEAKNMDELKAMLSNLKSSYFVK
jgi:transcriptional regulator with XRE-family HTH domain